MNAKEAQAKPAAWMTHHEPAMLFLDEKEAAAYCDDDEYPVPLFYMTPQPASDAMTMIDALLATLILMRGILKREIKKEE